MLSRGEGLPITTGVVSGVIILPLTFKEVVSQPSYCFYTLFHEPAPWGSRLCIAFVCTRLQLLIFYALGMGGTHPGLARALQRGIPILEFGVCQYGNRGMRFNLPPPISLWVYIQTSRYHTNIPKWEGFPGRGVNTSFGNMLWYLLVWMEIFFILPKVRNFPDNRPRRGQITISYVTFPHGQSIAGFQPQAYSQINGIFKF